MVQIMGGLVRCGLVVAFSVLMTGCATTVYEAPHNRANRPMMRDVLRASLSHAYPTGAEIKGEQDYFPEALRPYFRPSVYGGSGEQAFLYILGLKLSETDLSRKSILQALSKEAGCHGLEVETSIVVCDFDASELWTDPGGVNSIQMRRVIGLYVATGRAFFEFETEADDAMLKQFTASYGGSMESVGNDCTVTAWPLPQNEAQGENRD